MDAYTVCPGGCDKKIKFCCGVEIIADLEKLDRMLDGEQRRACVEHIAKMPAKFRDRPCVLVQKAEAHMMAGQLEAAEATKREMLAKYPDNPAAQARVAPHEIGAGRVREGVDLLQDAIASFVASEGKAPPLAEILMGLLNCGNALMHRHHIWAGRACLTLLGSLVDGSQIDDIVGTMNRDPTLPLALKEDPIVPEAPAGAPFRAEHDEIRKLAEDGRWREAARRYAELAERNPTSPAVWKSLAAMRSYLADDAGAAEAFRKYAALDVPADDAVEAELFAIVLSTPTDGPDDIEMVEVTLSIADYDQLYAQLSSDRRLHEIVADFASMAEEGQPGPRTGFFLLDRASPEASADLTREDIPRVLGDSFLYGKETDRPARLKLVARRPDLPRALALLNDAAGDLLGPPEGENVIRKIRATQEVLVWRWHLPVELPAQTRARLTADEFRHRFLNDWTQTRAPHLEGKTVREAAGDPRLRRRVQASILDLEGNARIQDHELDFNDLRSHLGLPVAVDIDPFRVDVETISILKLARLPGQLMPDEQLLAAFNLAASVRADRAIERLGEALLERPTVEDANKRTILLNLIRVSTGVRRKLDYLARGKALEEAAGASPVVWLLEELKEEFVHDLTRDNRAEHLASLIQQILQHRDPAVYAQLERILTRFGIIEPERLHQMANAPASMSVAGINLAPQPRNLSLEEAGTPAAAGGAETKSGLWLPGMD